MNGPCSIFKSVRKGKKLFINSKKKDDIFLDNFHQHVSEFALQIKAFSSNSASIF